MTQHTNWFESFFEGVAVDLWLKAVPPDVSAREADGILRLLDAREGAEILDVPCGGGRLANELSERGYRVTGVDLSAEFLGHARAADPAQRVNWEHRDMRDLPWPGRFDGAFCVGNSFGYLDDAGNAAFLRSVRGALKPGARFVLETPMVLENLLGHIQPRAWWQVGDMYLLVHNQYDAHRQRLDTEYSFIANGRVDVRHGEHRAYAYRDLIELVAGAGFAVAPSEPWTREAHSVTLVATAIQESGQQG